ncbi:capsular polysaccharide export protein, LipB/KpsS family [Haloplanus aerogenes]|uniref:Capsular polysaccharide biosynthesis protein n=1 Tax=Haloplanus aerogenes TaxID=660522 RepID=A0A3M0DS71_9EURY|nr:hypothetical protein [Haloplanus aerogenes]AZH26318.1 hypothetical protein DU502_13515 [Haloplanus aerogenes]RMB18223.1 capsular polysaccharide biosynthesis protein [Haloplanus aerogenes]
MELKHGVLAALSRFGLGQVALAAHDRVAEAPGIGIGVDDSIASYSLENDSAGTVLFPLIPGYSTLCYRFGALGHAFRTRGHRPLILYDDDDLRSSPELTVDSPHPSTTTELCRFRAKRVSSMFGLDTVSVSDALPAEYREPSLPNDIESATYRGVPVSRIATTSVKKYLKRYTLDLSDPNARSAYTDFLLDAMVLTDAIYALAETVDPELIVVNEPYYLQGAVPIAAGRQAGIGCYSQMNGYFDATIMFGRGDNRSPMPQFTNPDVVEAALEMPLSDDERATIETVMEGRKSGRIVRQRYSSGTNQSLDPDADTLVGVFTNLLWDASLIPEGAVYDDVYEWLSDTISELGGQSDIHAVIKTHPAEAKFGTRESVSGWLQDTYDQLPDNVTHLLPDTDVDTYALIETLDVGIVFNSTVGLEMAFEGKPVVTAGYPHYLGFGFTYDSDSKPAYRNLLGRLDELELSDEKQRRAERYAHFFFACKHLDFSIQDTDPGGRSANVVEHADLEPGSQPYDAIVEQILAGDEVIAPSCRHRIQ